MATVQKNTDGTLTVTFRDGLSVVFIKPEEKHLGLALASIRKDPLGMVDVVIDNCLVKGDKDVLKTTLGYCKQLAEVMDNIFDKKKASLEFTSDGRAYLNFEDGEIANLKVCDRVVYSESRTKSASNPLGGIKHIINQCLLEASLANMFKDPGYILGFSEVLDEYLEYTGRELGN